MRCDYQRRLGAALLRRCQWSLPAQMGTAAIASTEASTSVAALATSRRSYFWPYPDDFVPEGATTSGFQSSLVPSVRERVVREYALGPLFGQRTPCCVLGFPDAAREVMGYKAAVRHWVALAFGLDVKDVELGALQQTKEMMLHRCGTYESPRLADGVGSRPDAGARRLSRYARLPAEARTVVEVYVSVEALGNGATPAVTAELASAATEDAEAEAESDILAHGLYLQQMLHQHMNKMVGSGGAAAKDTEAEQDTVMACVAALHEECGVVYCEVPDPDESGFTFDRLHGHPVEADMVERVWNRWGRRLERPESQRRQTGSAQGGVSVG